MSESSTVIVGAGHAGVQATARLTELGWDGGIVLIDADDITPYERPPLSKEFLKAESRFELTLLRKDHFYIEKKIERVVGRSVAGIHPGTRALEFGDGERREYGKLILAPGSQPRQLNVPGADLAGVHMLKSWTDACALKRELIPGQRVVIVGAGYIGLEVAAAARHLGCAVTVLEYQDRVMSRVTSTVVSRHFEKLHREHGADIVLGSQVSRFAGTSRVGGVVTADGVTYPAGVVVVGIGVQPNQHLAQEAGIVCSDGIVVDEHSRTSAPHIYAIGDATRFVSIDKQVSRRLESVQNAVAQGIAAANDIASHTHARAEVPWFWTVQHGVRLQTAGLRHPSDDIVVRGEVGEGRFSVLYLRQGRLAAIDTVGSLKDFIPGKKLIAAGTRLDLTRAANPTIKLVDAKDGTGAQ